MKYSAPLDGIRGIAIVTVVLAHFGLPFLKRGGFGVDIFFTLSGFLITSILLSEYSETSDINFRNFYIRRGLRLFPALLSLLIVYGSLVVLFSKSLTRHFVDIGLVFFYVANWASAAGLNRPGELGHTWSLSVEEQFYLIWPVAVFYLVKKWGGKGLLCASIVLTTASMAENFLMARSVPWWRLYYGFDTRAFALLFGCTLAVLLHFWRDRATLPKWAEATLPYVACTGIAWFMFRTDGFLSDPNFFRGMIFAIPVFTCCLIYVAVMPGFFLTKKILSYKALVYFGKRSYGLYLWHYWIMNYWLADVSKMKGINVTVGWAIASLLVAEFSYRFVEMPFMSLKKRMSAGDQAPSTDTMPEPSVA